MISKWGAAFCLMAFGAMISCSAPSHSGGTVGLIGGPAAMPSEAAGGDSGSSVASKGGSEDLSPGNGATVDRTSEDGSTHGTFYDGPSTVASAPQGFTPGSEICAKKTSTLAFSEPQIAVTGVKEPSGCQEVLIKQSLSLQMEGGGVEGFGSVSVPVFFSDTDFPDLGLVTLQTSGPTGCLLTMICSAPQRVVKFSASVPTCKETQVSADGLFTVTKTFPSKETVSLIKIPETSPEKTLEPCPEPAFDKNIMQLPEFIIKNNEMRRKVSQ